MTLRLKWLKIEKYRNVKPGTHLTFNDHFNVPLGLNGSGKTTLLDLVAMAVSGEFASAVHEEFQIRYELASEHLKINIELDNKPVQVPVPTAAHVRHGESHQPAWTVQIRDSRGETDRRVECAGRDVLLSDHAGKALVLFLNPASPFEPAWLGACLAIATSDPQETGFQENVKFDEGLDLFRALLASLPARKAEPRIDVRQGQVGYLQLVPLDVAEAVAKRVGRKESPANIELTGAATPRFLEQLISKLELRSASVTPVWHGTVGEDEEGLYQFVGLRFRFSEDTRSFTQDQLSYGQKRLLTFFYYCACMPHIVIADELVNGMHHGWIRACLEEIGERQSFLTSQNALLLDYIPVKSPEEAIRTFILCKKIGGQLQWQNMDATAAKNVYEARKQGIRQLSEILITQGLW